MAAEFKYSVKAEPSGSVDYRVKAVKFGDGYMQISGDGINIVRKSWSLRHFGVKVATACVNVVLSSEVQKFLDDNAGKPIKWTDPDGHTAEWVCLRGTSSSEQGNTRIISWTFEEFN